MNRMQAQVREFPNTGDIPAFGEHPSFVRTELCMSLLREEFQEMLDAIESRNMPATIDAACDSIYVIFWTMNQFGIDLEPFFDEVHRTNMHKSTGPVLENGKRGKPSNWKPPRIAAMLDRLTKYGHVRCVCASADSAVVPDSQGGHRCDACGGFLIGVRGGV